jgi:hypothetical protein
VTVNNDMNDSLYGGEASYVETVQGGRQDTDTCSRISTVLKLLEKWDMQRGNCMFAFEEINWSQHYIGLPFVLYDGIDLAGKQHGHREMPD